MSREVNEILQLFLHVHLLLLGAILDHLINYSYFLQRSTYLLSAFGIFKSELFLVYRER